ncbi:hypothetical protein SARC_01383 [Sphaeroforma arctica JP610]|uniref:LRRK2 ARM repeat domain-containing protein n=1 Tax=Sphaeroforma arctica JP610 TaxID=667725 RepID=A0A0L0GC38_9EUKA|nr:hypothetical protein SARC_01383 [Sphaeroforma arctica JP610]KNC86474.1 hypothetical protein SARC_01383 [Sphaeroforma arctica JP610]|eukprot:XP_014160376.1 hypothetical protein SARC_01383 [Sphaeroforma arctica JP610]
MHRSQRSNNLNNTTDAINNDAHDIATAFSGSNLNVNDGIDGITGRSTRTRTRSRSSDRTERPTLKRRVTQLLANIRDGSGSSTGSSSSRHVGDGRSGSARYASSSSNSHNRLTASSRWLNPKNRSLTSILDSLAAWKEMEPNEVLECLCRFQVQIESEEELATMSKSERQSTALSRAVRPISEILRVALEDRAMLLINQSLVCMRQVTKGDAVAIEMATNLHVPQLIKDVMVQNPRDAVIQRNCYMVYRSLTFHRADNQQYIVQQLDVVPLVCKAMRNMPNNPSLQAAGFMLIQNVTWLVDANRCVVDSDGGIQLILDAMKRFPFDTELQKWGCGAIQNLACSIDCTAKIVKMKALDVVLAAMRHFPSNVVMQNYGLGVMRNLSFLKTNRVAVAMGGDTIALALAAMSKHFDSIEVQSSACSFLFNVIIDVEENREILLKTKDFLPMLFTFKRRHDQDLRFYEKSNALLEQLARGTEGSCYIDLGECKTAFSLKELAARTVAYHLKKPVSLGCEDTSMLFPDLKNCLKDARDCDWCEKKFIQYTDIAYKSKPDRWALRRVCSRNCLQNVIDDTVSRNKSVLAVEVESAALVA